MEKMREQRIRLEIYQCFIDAIINPNTRDYYLHKKHEPIGLTHIQLHCKMAYDKARMIMMDLVKFGLITIKPIKVTQRGFEFYTRATTALQNRDLLLAYMTESKEIPKINFEMVPGLNEMEAKVMPELHIMIEGDSRLWVGEGTVKKPYVVPTIDQLESIMYAIQETYRKILKKQKKDSK